MTRSILVMVSIDTEEDNWRPCRDGVTIDNIRELPRLDALLRRLGVRATYFTTYQVAIREWAVGLLQELQAGGAGVRTPPPPGDPPPGGRTLSCRAIRCSPTCRPRCSSRSSSA